MKNNPFDLREKIQHSEKKISRAVRILLTVAALFFLVALLVLICLIVFCGNEQFL
jgi:hypothetical protein